VLTYFRWWVESKKPPGKAEVEVYMKKYGILMLNSEHYKVYKNCVYTQYRKKGSLFVVLHNRTCEQSTEYSVHPMDSPDNLYNLAKFVFLAHLIHI
jgi:hypothetical protein